VELLTLVTALAGGFDGDHVSAATLEGPDTLLAPRRSPARQQPGQACADEGHSASSACTLSITGLQKAPTRSERDRYNNASRKDRITGNPKLMPPGLVPINAHLGSTEGMVGYSEVIQTGFWEVETATGWPCLAVSRANPKLTRYPFLI